ncbi:MAG TPA: VOC family protein [Actinomycetota bacterium]|nr:VOC family protein [Actinomycetota bacterium]
MIETTSVTVGIPVADLEEAIRWYTRLLDAGSDIEPVEGVVEFEVRDGFWLQLFEGAGGSGEAVIRLGVLDIDAARERLVGIGLEVGEIERIPNVIAFCDLMDPWGNGLSLYQVLPAAS